MKLVSVIVPVYNGEKYLRECVDSILANTYSNLEIILVNDGSTDTTAQICDEYAKKDIRIVVIHQKNKGIVGARNVGLDIAHGTYIGFVDADDSISPVFFEKMVAAIEAENADLVACEYRHQKDKIVSDGVVEDHYTCADTFEKQMAILTCAPAIRPITWTGPFVWDKLYRKAKIREQFRKECLMCEDLRFNWDYLKNCKKMVLVPAGLYFYRISEQSITGMYRKKKNNVINGISNATLWADIAQNAPIADEQLKGYLEARAAYTAHGGLWRVYRAGAETEYNAFVLKARNLIRAHCHKLFRDTETYSFKVRGIIWVCSYCFPLWKTAARLSSIV